MTDYKFVDVEIEGVTPLIQHKFSDHSAVNGGKPTRKIMVDEKVPREEAEKNAYRTVDNEIYHPGAAISRLLREAGSQHKLKGSRKAVKYLVPAAVMMMDDNVFVRGKDGKVLKTFEVDARSVVIPSTKGRIMCWRPRHDQWVMRFRLRINESVLPCELIHQLLMQGGEQIGIGDFRPEKGGPFGTFRVTKWKEEKTPKKEIDRGQVHEETAAAE